jgi:hypothetical protein
MQPYATILISDSSKKRHSIRLKIASDKTRLGKVVATFNILTPDSPLTDADADNGVFPWVESSIGKY